MRLPWAAALAAVASFPRCGAAAAAMTDKRKELVEVQRQLEMRKREIEDYRRQEERLQDELSGLEAQASDSGRKLRALQSKIHESESRASALKGHLGVLQLAEGRWRGVLADELRGYQRSVESESALYGSGELWRETYRRGAILQKVRYLQDVRGIRRQTETDAANARVMAADLKEKTKGVRAEQRSRQSLYEHKRVAYRQARGRLEQVERTIRELQDSALALTHLMRTLERRAPYKARGGPVPLAEPRHSLPWPADGQIVSTFGRKQIKELHTWVIQQGIRLAVPASAPVRAVKDGKVIFAGPFRSYGRVLIVDHGQAFFTIYGQLGTLLKKKGEPVAAEERIAAAGSDGAVYFELRQSGDALDPLEWLRKR